MKNSLMKRSACCLILFLFILLFSREDETFAANWWDKFGEPQYGGSITFAVPGLMAVNFDVYSFIGSEYNFFYEALFEPDWILDRKIYGMKTNFIPDQYWKGNLAESWEIQDGRTVVVRIRKGIHWQNKPPVNGREFTAYDVQAHYNRILGTGGGYTWKSSIYAGMTSNLEKITVRDKYTVVYKFKKPSAMAFQTIAERISLNTIEAPEWVALGGPPVKPEEPKGGPGPAPAPGGPPPMPDFGSGPLQDWKKAVGTGPWMLEKYVRDTSFTFKKNPDYWGTDPRYPKNRLPYADKLSLIVIPAYSTRVAALRTGKIDLIGNAPGGALDWKQAKTLNKTNPDLLQFKGPQGASGVAIRVDKAPYTDIRVRKALNMAIDRKTIAKSIYGGTVDGNPAGMITREHAGYAFDYQDWPQSLKNEYAYNPEGAKRLLAEAGYPKGFKTNVIVPSSDSGLDIVQAYKSYFKDIGIDMDIKTMDSISCQAYLQAGKHDQLCAQGGATTFPPNRALDIFYSKGSSDAVYYGLNNKSDPVYDKLHDDFIAEISPARSVKIFQQMDRRVIEQHYLVVPCEYYSYVVSQPYLKGYSGESLLWGQGITWSRLWIDKDLKKKSGR